MEVLYEHHHLPRGIRPPMASSPMPVAARSRYLLDLLAQVPGPRKRRGRRHGLAGLLAAGIAAVIAGPQSFAAIEKWTADAEADVLRAGLGDRAAVPAAVREVDSTAPEAFGAVAMSAPPDSITGRVTLTHEIQHAKLGALLDLVTLTMPDTAGELRRGAMTRDRLAACSKAHTRTSG